MLKALTTQEGALLRGRGAEIEAIATNCDADRFTVLTAEPGCGITSLLEAGVAPALRQAGFIVATFSNWADRSFGDHLREAVANAVRDQTDPLFFAQHELLDDILTRARRRTGRRVAVLLDQFEDYLYIHARTDLAHNFDAELAFAITNREGIFVIGLQEQALPVFDRFAPHIPNLLGYQIRLGGLPADAARQVVTEAARERKLEVDAKALDMLLTAPIIAGNDVRNDSRVHPLYMLTAANQLLDSAGRLKLKRVGPEALEQLGGDRVVLESFDSAIAELESSHTELLFRLCNILISPEKRRLWASDRTIEEYSGRLSRFRLTLLPKLLEMGIFRILETPDALRYQLARESFTAILNDWWQRREAAVASRRRAIFRITSISVAVGAIVAVYIVWLILPKK